MAKFFTKYHEQTLVVFAVTLACSLLATAFCLELFAKPVVMASKPIKKQQTSSHRRTQPTTSQGIVLGGRLLSDWKLYVDPNTPARNQADAWRASRPADAKSMDYMAAQPQAKWIGDWDPDPYTEVRNYTRAAQRANALPIFVLYNLPGRDCGGFSAGGANNTAAYKQWANRAALGLGQYPAIVIIEPDALAELDECFNTQQQADINKLFADTISSLRKNKNVLIYLDAGHSGWQDATIMAQRLTNASVAKADGFSLNISNFMLTSDEIAYGTAISQEISNKHFIIDTSRNGNGSNGEWCNPTGRALGQAPTLKTNNTLVDVFMWVKIPGESDGTCDRGEPQSGVWWPEYALDLAQRAGH